MQKSCFHCLHFSVKLGKIGLQHICRIPGQRGWVKRSICACKMLTDYNIEQMKPHIFNEASKLTPIVAPRR